MIKAKAALVRDGIIEKAGRGRISREGHAHLKKLYDKGERFTDWPKGEIEVTKTVDAETKTETETVKVKRDASTDKPFLEPVPYRYDEKLYKAVEVGTKRERSMREACHHCRASLVVCWCERPRIVAIPPLMDNVEVKVVRKSE